MFKEDQLNARCGVLADKKCHLTSTEPVMILISRETSFVVVVIVRDFPWPSFKLEMALKFSKAFSRKVGSVFRGGRKTWLGFMQQGETMNKIHSSEGLTWEWLPRRISVITDDLSVVLCDMAQMSSVASASWHLKAKTRRACRSRHDWVLPS